MSLRTHLRVARAKHGHTQEQAAEAIGVSRKALSLWEAERTTPSVDSMAGLASYLDVSLEEVAALVEPRVA